MNSKEMCISLSLSLSLSLSIIQLDDFDALIAKEIFKNRLGKILTTI
jgi:hypothetical protein